MAVAQSKTLQKQNDASRSPTSADRFAGDANPYPLITDKITITPVHMLNEYVAVLPVRMAQDGDIWTPDVKMNQGVVVGVTEAVSTAHGINIGDIVSYSPRTVSMALEDAKGYNVALALYSRASLFCVLGKANFVLAKTA